MIADDAVLDDGQREIDDKAIVIIAKRQPMADDLREIIGAIRISADLERVGDLGKNIAKRVVAVTEGRQPPSLFRGLQALAELALTQLKEVLDVYASRSVDRIGFVRDRDEEIDAMYTSLFRELLTYMMEDPRNITRVHASAVLRQEHRAHRRPRHQYRGDGLLHRHRQADAARAAQGRHQPPHRAARRDAALASCGASIGCSRPDRGG